MTDNSDQNVGQSPQPEPESTPHQEGVPTSHTNGVSAAGQPSESHGPEENARASYWRADPAQFSPAQPPQQPHMAPPQQPSYSGAPLPPQQPGAPMAQQYPVGAPYSPGMPGSPAYPAPQKQPSKFEAFVFGPAGARRRLGGLKVWRWSAFTFFIISLLVGLFGFELLDGIFESPSVLADVSFLAAWAVIATGFFGMWASGMMMILCTIGERIQQQNTPET